ncbi:MAG: TolC family protein [bacterium]|nr:TolC family protein [bacterium]
MRRSKSPEVRESFWRAARRLSLLALLILSSSSVRSETSLTVVEARLRALGFNRTYLTAQEDITKARADVTKARSGALPTVTVNGNYSRNFSVPSSFVTIDDETAEFKFGFKNTFGASLSAVQSIWQGGKVFTALSIAKDYRNYSEQVAGTVEANVIYQAEVLFYSVMLAQARLDVLEKSFEANSYSLDVIEKKYAQGMVSEYELLRARVEQSNLRPQILQAESDQRLSEKRLKSFLGIDLDEPLIVVEEAGDTSLVRLPSLSALTSAALAQRPEMRQADYFSEITRKAIRVARADYFPSLSAVMDYSWSAQSDAITLKENQSRSWTAGLNLSIPIFRGGQTRGAVTQAVSDHSQARLARSQTVDDIKLEVEEAYDRIMQAKEALDIQGNTIAQAEKGMEIANLRYESGIGTQLEVLSAETALRDARRILAEALFSFRQAKAGLKKATTMDLDKL